MDHCRVYYLTALMILLFFPFSGCTKKGGGRTCGEIEDSHLVLQVKQRTASETEAIECMDVALENCEPKLLQIVNGAKGDMVIEVLGSGSGSCRAKLSYLSLNKSSECSIPSDFLADNFATKRDGGQKAGVTPRIAMLMGMGVLGMPAKGISCTKL